MSEEQVGTVGTAETAVRRAVEAHEQQVVKVSVPLLGTVTLPPPARLAWYAGIGALVALEIVEWPIAVVMGIGHALADQRHSRLLHELGEGLEQA